MFDWLRKRKSPPETSSGGSTILRYPNDPSTPKLDIPTEETANFGQQRESTYETLFGPILDVDHELLPLSPHIDVYNIPPAPSRDRDFYTLVTGGMSDLPMRVPPGSGAPRRVELIFYCAEPLPEYKNLLHFLARFPLRLQHLARHRPHHPQWQPASSLIPQLPF